MSEYAYLSSDELMHYGVLGMKWGVRKQEPYSPYTHSKMRDPSANAKIAKGNVRSAYKNITNNALRVRTTEKKISKINKKLKEGRGNASKLKAKRRALSSDSRYKESKRVVGTSISELKKAEKVLGRSVVQKQLNNRLRARQLVSSIAMTGAYNAGRAALAATGIPVGGPPLIIVPDRKASAAIKTVNEKLYGIKSKKK